MNTIIEKIRAEVERRKKEMVDASFPPVIKKTRISELSIVLDILDDIQERTDNPITFTLQEQPVKVGDKVSIIKKKEGIVTRISDGKARVETGDTMEIVNLSDLVTEQPACEGLEEVSEALAEQHGFVKNPNCKPAKYSWSAVRDVFIEGVKAGAQWQKEQMMKEAVEGEVVTTNKYASVRYLSRYGTFIYFYGIGRGYQKGDKVKLIIIKED